MKLLIKDRFFSNADVLRRFALDSNYLDSTKILSDVGWRGYRTEEFDLLDNQIISEASDETVIQILKFTEFLNKVIKFFLNNLIGKILYVLKKI